MTKTDEPKNVYYLGEQKMFKRWTVLKVDAESVDFVKDFAERNGFTTGKALQEIITRAKKREKSKA